MSEEIKGVKLTTGIDVIGKPVTLEDGTVILNESMMIQLVQGPQGMAVALTPIDMFSSYAEEQKGTKLELHPSSMMFPPYEPHPNLVTRYNEEMSGIDLSAAQKPGIIT